MRVARKLNGKKYRGILEENEGEAVVGEQTFVPL
jgi:hypothetical protein